MFTSVSPQVSFPTGCAPPKANVVKGAANSGKESLPKLNSDSRATSLRHLEGEAEVDTTHLVGARLMHGTNAHEKVMGNLYCTSHADSSDDERIDEGEDNKSGRIIDDDDDDDEPVVEVFD